MSTDTTSKVTANTVKAPEIKPSAPAAAPAPAPAAAAPAAAAPAAQSKYKSEDFNGAPIVKLKILTANTMQYDPQYHLLLDSTTPVEMPLTPFFASRLGVTVELCN